MRPLVFPHAFLCLLGAVAFIGAHAASLPIFWEREFEQGAASWTRYCSALGLKDSADNYGLHTPAQWQSLGDRLVAQHDSENPWFAFLSGMVLIRTNSQGAANQHAAAYLAKALSLASTHPGYCWILVAQLHRFGETEAEENALKNLEKVFLASGAQSAPIVSQQLMWYAFQAEKAGRKDQAFRYLTWAAAFEKHAVWPWIRTAWIALPAHVDRAAAAVNELIHAIRESWPAQLAMARGIVEWLANVVSILVAAIILCLGLKYISRPLHRVAHLFPAIISLHIRQGLAGAIYASLIFFGIIPFLWLTAILIWRHLAGREKIIAGVCCGFLILAPLHTRLHSILTHPLRPDSSLFLFEKVLNEGYYPELDALVQAHAQANPNDYLALVASAVSALKSGDGARASAAIRSAEALQPTDPVVLLTAANIYRFSSDVARADQYFTKCISSFPELEASYFNPTLTYFDERRFIEGIDLIKNASKINPRIIGAFTRKNDDFFAGAWPPLRQFLQPDYRSDYFFWSVLPKNAGSWRTADDAWGMAFLGIPLLPSLCLFIAFLAIIAGKSKVASRSSGDFQCRLCGIPMCRSCKRGDACLDCHLRVGDIHDVAVAQKIRQAIVTRRQRRTLILPRLIDIAFPGLGTLVFADAFHLKSLLCALTTGGLFGAYTLAAQASFSVPAWAASGMATPLIAAGTCYQAVFLALNIVAVAKILRAK